MLYIIKALSMDVMDLSVKWLQCIGEFIFFFPLTLFKTFITILSGFKVDVFFE